MSAPKSWLLITGLNEMQPTAIICQSQHISVDTLKIQQIFQLKGSGKGMGDNWAVTRWLG